MMEAIKSPIKLTEHLDSDHVVFPREDGSQIPYKAFSSQAAYEREQERIYRGPAWNFVALEAEITHAGDFESTPVGDTRVAVTRLEDGSLRSNRQARFCSARCRTR